jgi:perosamine synthetase
MSLVSGPHPRYRLYTSRASYLQPLKAWLFGRHDEALRRLEGKVAEQVGVKHGICVPQARVGIYLAIRNLISAGQEVVMSPYTIADVVNMVLAAGGKPKFVELEANTCNANPEDVERQISSRTGAVLITHLHGCANHPLRMREICDSHGIPLIEDAAQAFGGISGEDRLGSIGRAGIYSFGTYKNVNAWYGGMVVTNDGELADSIRAELANYPNESMKKILKRARKGLITDVVTQPLLFRSLTFKLFKYGMLNDVNWINRRVNTELDLNRYDVFPDTYRRRMTGMQARLAESQLDQVQANTLKRIRHAEAYHTGLSGLPGIVLPPLRLDGSHIYTYFPVQFQDRTAAIKWMMRHGRDCAAQHLRNCAGLSSFKEFARELPIAESVANSVVLFPTYPRYPDSEVARNIEQIRAYVNSN